MNTNDIREIKKLLYIYRKNWQYAIEVKKSAKLATTIQNQTIKDLETLFNKSIEKVVMELLPKGTDLYDKILDYVEPDEDWGKNPILKARKIAFQQGIDTVIDDIRNKLKDILK